MTDDPPRTIEEWKGEPQAEHEEAIDSPGRCAAVGDGHTVRVAVGPEEELVGMWPGTI